MMKQTTETMTTQDHLSELRGLPRWWFLTKKLFEYLGRYANNPYYLYLYLSRSQVGSYKEHVDFFSDEEFLKTAEHTSSIRFGDGEFGMLTSQKSIHFQRIEPALREFLLKILHSYNTESPYILGVNPQIIIPNNILENHQMKFLFMQQKLGYRLFSNKKRRYFNASYFYIDNKAKEFLQTISKDKHTVVVTNRDTLAIVRERITELFPKAASFSFVETPVMDAFDKYQEILTATLSSSLQPNSVVFAACGPAGKALVYELAKRNILAHDIGHGLKFATEEDSKENLIKWEELKYYLK